MIRLRKNEKVIDSLHATLTRRNDTANEFKSFICEISWWQRLSLASLVSLDSGQSRVSCAGLNVCACMVLTQVCVSLSISYNLDWRPRHFNSTAKILIAKRFTRRNFATGCKRTGWLTFERSAALTVVFLLNDSVIRFCPFLSLSVIVWTQSKNAVTGNS